MNFLHNRMILFRSGASRQDLFRCAVNKCGIVKSLNISVLIASAIIVLLGFGCAVGDDPKRNYDYNDPMCVAAGAGELKPETFENVSSTDRSFLLSCALSVVVGEADRTMEERGRLINKKQKLSDAILSKSIDIEFIGHEGNHLLNDLILSFFPEKWKIETLKKLIDMGGDVKHRNKHGKNAMDLAKFRGQEKIVKLLSAEHR